MIYLICLILGYLLGVFRVEVAGLVYDLYNKVANLVKKI